MLLPDILHMPQPIITQAKPVAPQRRAHAAASIVSANNDVTHLQDIDRKLHDRQTVEVGVHDEIGDVAVDKQFSGREADDLIGRHPAVGAANPEIGGRLLP